MRRNPSDPPAPELGNQRAKKDKPKTKWVQIRVEPLAHEALTDAAKKEGLTLTDFVLSACLEKIARQR